MSQQLLPCSMQHGHAAATSQVCKHLRVLAQQHLVVVMNPDGGDGSQPKTSMTEALLHFRQLHTAMPACTVGLVVPAQGPMQWAGGEGGGGLLAGSQMLDAEHRCRGTAWPSFWP